MMGEGRNGREIEGGGFATLPYCDVVYTIVQLHGWERETGGERHATWMHRRGCAGGGGDGGGAAEGGSQDAEGVARVGPSVAGVAIKYNFRGVGLIPRIPRKYFIYYLHFVDT